MATGVYFTRPQGFDEMSIALKNLGPKVANKLVTQALRAGGQIITREMKARAPVGEKDKTGKYPHKAGDLKRSIRLRVGKTRGKGEKKMIIVVGADKGKWFNIFYPWWVEFGHKAGKRSAGQAGLQRTKRKVDFYIDAAKRGLRSAKTPRSRRRIRERLRYLLAVKSGKISDKRKDVPPRPFIRPAFDNKKREASQAIEAILATAIDKQFKELAP